MLEVQEYLRSGHTLEDLFSVYAIASKAHQKYPNLWLLKYNQIDSPFSEEIVRECRGIVLDRDRDWEIVSRSYEKFFNLGEGLAATIDWTTAKVYEKVDGSLMVLYWYDGKWQVQSSGSPDASGNVNGTDTTFGELFWRVWQKLGYSLPPEENKRYCYSFELMTPFNRVVVPHKTSRIVLHGIRHLDSGELPPSPENVQPSWGWEIIRGFPLQSWDDVLKASRELNLMEQEGYVVCDAQFHRVKVKGPQYVAIHRMRDGMSTRRMLEIVRSNEYAEFLAYYPEYQPFYDEISVRYRAMIDELMAVYDGIKDIPGQKEFALEATKHKMSGALFSLRSKKIASIQEYMAKMPIRNLIDYLKVKEISFDV